MVKRKSTCGLCNPHKKGKNDTKGKQRLKKGSRTGIYPSRKMTKKFIIRKEKI